MKKFKKITALILSSIMIAGIAVGCGSDEEPAATTTPAAEATAATATGSEAPTGEVKNLDFIWFSDGNEGEVTKAIIADYEKANPDIKINLIETPYKDLDQKLRTMVSGGEPPALARLTDVAIFKDYLVDLTPYVGDKEAYLQQFNEIDKPMYVIDDQIKALPTDTTVNSLIYNKTAFDKAGVAVPQSVEEVWTWDEWTTAMKTVMEKGGVKYGLVIDKSAQRWSTLLYEAGGRHIDDAGNCVINSPEGVRAMDKMVSLHTEGICPESVWVGSENPNNLFRTGQVAMHLSGNWMLTNYRDNITDFEWGVTYLPQDKMRSSVVGGKYVGAFQESGFEEEAADFMQYFTSQEVNAKYCQESLFISPRKDNANLTYSYGQEYFDIFTEELAATPLYSGMDFANPYYFATIKNDLRDGTADVIVGNKTSQEFLDEMQVKGQAALDENK